MRQIDKKIELIKYSIEQFHPIYLSLDLKIRRLQLELRQLEDEKLKLIQGQMIFDSDVDF